MTVTQLSKGADALLPQDDEPLLSLRRAAALTARPEADVDVCVLLGADGRVRSDDDLVF